MALSEQDLDLARRVKEQGGSQDDFLEILEQKRKQDKKLSRQESRTWLTTEPEQFWPQQQELKAPLVWPSVLDTIRGESNRLQDTAESDNVRWMTEFPDILWWIKDKTGFSLPSTLASWTEDLISKPLTKFSKSSEEAAESFTTKASWKEWLKEASKKIAKNIIPSLWKQWAGIIGSFANPIETTEWILNLGQWISDKIVFNILDTFSSPFGKEMKTESGQTKMLDAIWRKIKQDYGTPKKVKKELIENPALLLEIWVSAIKKLWRSKLTKQDLKKIDELEEQVVANIEESINPTTKVTKQQTSEITPWIKERLQSWELTPSDRKTMKLQVDNEVQRIWSDIGDFIKEWKVKWEINLGWMVDVLVKEDSKIRLDWVIIPWNETKSKFINTQLEFLASLEKKFGKNLPTSFQNELRQKFDVVFDKTITRDKITKFQDELQVSLADSLRAELAKNNPDLDKMNQNYHFYKGFQNVLDETIERKIGQDPLGLLWTIQTGVWSGIWATIWTGVGWPVWWTIGAITWWAIWSKLTRVLKSPKYKLASAKQKADMADAIANWDVGKLEKILDSIIIGQGISELTDE